MSVALLKPVTFGKVSESLFDGIISNDAFVPGPVRWEDVPGAAHPLVETIAYAVGKNITEHTLVVVDQKVVRPWRVHRAHGAHWHRDEGESYVVVNTLPTEYLVGELAHGARKLWDATENPGEEDYKKLADSFGPQVVKEGIGLETWIPKEGEIVRQHFSNIHRSPVNTGNNPIHRAFVALIFEEPTKIPNL